MKLAFFSFFTVIAVGSFAIAAQPKPAKTAAQKICEAFQTKIDDECNHIMCDDGIANGSYKDIDECTSQEDYAEAAQGGCDGQPTTMEDLVKAYNQKHPTSKIKCD